MKIIRFVCVLACSKSIAMNICSTHFWSYHIFYTEGIALNWISNSVLLFHSKRPLSQTNEDYSWNLFHWRLSLWDFGLWAADCLPLRPPSAEPARLSPAWDPRHWVGDTVARWQQVPLPNGAAPHRLAAGECHRVKGLVWIFKRKPRLIHPSFSLFFPSILKFQVLLCR